MKRSKNRCIFLRDYLFSLIIGLSFFLQPYQLFAQTIYVPSEVPLIEVYPDGKELPIKHFDINDIASVLRYDFGPIFLNESQISGVLNKSFPYADDFLVNDPDNYKKALEYYDYVYAAVVPNLHRIVGSIQAEYDIKPGETLNDLMEANQLEENDIDFDRLEAEADSVAIEQVNEDLRVKKMDSLKSSLEIIDRFNDLRVSYHSCEIRMYPFKLQESTSSALGQASYQAVNYFTHPYLCTRRGNKRVKFWNNYQDETKVGYTLAMLEKFSEDVLENNQGIRTFKQFIFDELVEERNAFAIEMQDREPNRAPADVEKDKEKLDEYDDLIARYEVETQGISNVSMIKQLYLWSKNTKHLMLLSIGFLALSGFLTYILKLVLTLLPNRIKNISLRLMARMKNLTNVFGSAKKGVRVARTAKNLSQFTKFFRMTGPMFWIYLGIFFIGMGVYLYKQNQYLTKTDAAEFFKMTFNKIMNKIQYLDISRSPEDDYYRRNSYVFLDTKYLYEEGEITASPRYDDYHHWYIHLSDDPVLAKVNYRNEIRYQPRYVVDSVIDDSYLPLLEDFILKSYGY